MWWLSIVGPIALALIYVATAHTDKRRAAEAEKWRVRADAKRVNRAPPELQKMFKDAGAGAPVGIFEIIPKLAYLGVFDADLSGGSDHQTVVAKVERVEPAGGKKASRAVALTAQPIPVVDGARVENKGIPFPKHTEFTDSFVVEGDPEDLARAWLSSEVREALLDRPDAWLRVSDCAMALTLYGPADADLLDDLLFTADAIFAERGAEGAPSLLLDEEEPPPAPSPKGKPSPNSKKKA
jgi:hypothetical protein